MSILVRLALCLLCVNLFESKIAHGADSSVFFDQDYEENEFKNLEITLLDGSISGFVINKKDTSVYLKEDRKEPYPVLGIYFSLRPYPPRKVIFNKTLRLRGSSTGEYFVELPIHKDDNIALFEAISEAPAVAPGSTPGATPGAPPSAPTPTPRKEWVRFKFTSTGISESFRGLKFKKVPGRFAFSAGAGVSSISYTQTRVPSISMLSLTGKAAIRWSKRGSPWSIFGNAFGNTFNFNNSPADRSIKFFGTNLRGTYNIPFERSRWAIQMSLGVYLSTSFGATSNFGYQNITGPQVYPSFRFIDKKWGIWIAYFKFSPVSSSFQLLDSSGSREVAAGLTYALRPNEKRQYWAFSVDWSDLKVTIGSSQFTVKQITAGASYQL